MAEEKQNNIAEIFNAEKGSIAILYDGIWGIGKTHDWNNEISPKLQTKEKYYVSLFGLKNAADIKDKFGTTVGGKSLEWQDTRSFGFGLDF